MKINHCVQRCSKLEDKVVSLESWVDQVEHYGRRNNIVITGIPDDIGVLL